MRRKSRVYLPAERQRLLAARDLVGDSGKRPDSSRKETITRAQGKGTRWKRGKREARAFAWTITPALVISRNNDENAGFLVSFHRANGVSPRLSSPRLFSPRPKLPSFASASRLIFFQRRNPAANRKKEKERGSEWSERGKNFGIFLSQSFRSSGDSESLAHPSPSISRLPFPVKKKRSREGMKGREIYIYV